jgi:hypothetical protein
MALEMELFNFGDVRITDKSVRVRQRAFSMESLIGVEVIYRNRPWAPVLISLIASVACEAAGRSLENIGFHIAALVFLVITATFFWNGGPRYTIALDTAEGYFMPLTSADRFFVESIAQVLETALRNDTKYAPVRKPAAARAIPQMPAFQVMPPKAQPAAATAHFATALHPATHARLFKYQN